MVMGRRFLASLKDTFRGMSTSAHVPGETKTVTMGTWSQSSWSSVHGTEGRADGWDMDTVINDAYEGCVWTWRCTEKISSDGSRLPFAAALNLGKEDEERLDGHPLFRLLNRRANPLETGKIFRKRAFAQAVLSKRGVFIEVVKTRGGTPSRLDLLHPQRIRIVPSMRGDYIDHFEYTRADGLTREIDPSRIRWIRNPHPTDPFSGVTPLDSAGVSVDMDLLARMYNINFLRNDGRPGGIVGIDADGLPEGELQRIERKFKPGVIQAGRLIAVGTGPNGLDYVDTGAKPRDMAYEQMSAISKNEILSAFGIGESLLGNAAGRTFDNAEQENYTYWAEVMPDWLDMFASAFIDDFDGDFDPFIDTSTVNVLELPRRKRREEARQEVQHGLRSIDEYRPLSDLPAVATPQSRALWVSPAKAPIPTDPGDAEALGIGGEQQPAPGGAPGQAPQGAPGGTAADLVDAARTQEATGGAAGLVAAARGAIPTAGPGPAADLVAAAQIPQQASTGHAAADLVAAAVETKTAQQDPQWEPGQAEWERAETAAAGAVDALLARQLGVAEARLRAPKTRRGTRWWSPSGPDDTGVGAEPLDPGQVLDEDRWAQEAADTVAPIATATAGAVAAGMAGAFTGAEPGEAVTQLTGKAVFLAVSAVAEAVRDWTRRLKARLASADGAATSVDDLVAAVKDEHARYARGMVDRLAVSFAQQAVNGAAEDVAAGLEAEVGPGGIPERVVVRSWLTRADARVRDAHREVAGQSRQVGDPFTVGGVLLRYPGDPAGPPSLVLNCRCRLVYRAVPPSRV